MNNIQTTTSRKEIVIYDDERYYKEETETHTILKSIEKCKYGMHTTLRFTKDKEKSDCAIENFGRMLTRALIRGDI